MRKRNVTHVADTIFWWVIYTLPILCFIGYFIMCIVSCNGLPIAGNSVVGSAGGQGDWYWNEQWTTDGWFDAIHDLFLGIPYNFEEFMHGSFFIGVAETPIFVALQQACDLIMDGNYPMGDRGALLMCFTWFIYMNILHIMIDFIVFIPRLCHKWLGKAYQDD